MAWMITFTNFVAKLFENSTTLASLIIMQVGIKVQVGKLP